MNKSLVSILFVLSLFFNGKSQFLVNAGTNTTVCNNSTVVQLGGNPSATGGRTPYRYKWQPSTFLNNDTIANPIASNNSYFIQYTLTVTDAEANTAVGLVYINYDRINQFSAGIDTGYCYGQSSGVAIGSAINNNTWHTFYWQPAFGLSSTSAANPVASPSVNTTYTLTVSDGVCPDNISRVTVSAFLPPATYAGADTTIEEGQVITLRGSGGNTFWWQPDYNIKYMTSKNADVWPITTTTYNLYSENSHKCYASDEVIVTVLSNNKLIFYSAFTPNNDGDNDVFYIANLEKFPDNELKIYNRYGKIVFNAKNYNNDWNGTYLGNLVPTGTYFYTLDDGIDKQYKGTVTIIR
jgi:gliding motility-associated-like protein